MHYYSMRMRVLVTVFLVLFGNNRVSIAADANGAFPALFAFGDSILDTGNNNNLATLTKCNFPPYGKDFYGGMATGRFGDGRVLSDLIAAGLRIKEALPPYLSTNIQPQDFATGVSFASGGSGSDDLTANMQGVLPLSSQLRMFQDYIGKLKGMVGEQRAAAIISNALILFSSGNNDIALTYSFTVRRSMLFPLYADTLVASSSNFLKSLYQLGARHVWVLSTLPLGCLPGARTSLGGPLRLCGEILNQEAQIFNSKLSSAAMGLRSSLPYFDVRFIDVYTPMLNLINNPLSAGFVNVANGCCGTGVLEIAELCNIFSGSCLSPSTYFFWDSGHPTQRAYELTVAAILQSQSHNYNASSYNVNSTSLSASPLRSSVSH